MRDQNFRWFLRARRDRSAASDDDDDDDCFTAAFTRALNSGRSRFDNRTIIPLAIVSLQLRRQGNTKPPGTLYSTGAFNARELYISVGNYFRAFRARSPIHKRNYFGRFPILKLKRMIKLIPLSRFLILMKCYLDWFNVAVIVCVTQMRASDDIARFTRLEQTIDDIRSRD